MVVSGMKKMEIAQAGFRLKNTVATHPQGLCGDLKHPYRKQYKAGYRFQQQV